MNFIFQFMRLIWTPHHTIAATDTSLRKKLDLRVRMSSLGIVAPETAQ